MPLTQEQFEVMDKQVPWIVYRWLQGKPSTFDEVEDLTSAAWEGVCQAAERWKPDRGAGWQHYATIRARGAMIDAWRKHNGAMRGKTKGFRRTEEWVEESPVQWIEDFEDATNMAIATMQALDQLPERSAGMIYYRFFRDETYLAIGNRYGCTETRTWQIVQQTLRRLKALLD